MRLDGDRYIIEMAPVWGNKKADRGVVCEGAVGLPWLGHSRFFRYEVRCWRDGVIPDVSEAVDSPRRLSANTAQARQVLDLVSAVPTVTWGRDELRAGEMWNSNSLISWLLARAGHDTDVVNPPAHGRAPDGQRVWSSPRGMRGCDPSKPRHGVRERRRVATAHMVSYPGRRDRRSDTLRLTSPGTAKPASRDLSDQKLTGVDNNAAPCQPTDNS